MDKEVSRLIEALKDPKTNVREEAACDLGDGAAVPRGLELHDLPPRPIGNQSGGR